MPDFEAPRDVTTRMIVRRGGAFYVALNGPQGEATRVNIGIEDPADDGCVLSAQFTADRAEDVGNSLLKLAQLLRDGK